MISFSNLCDQFPDAEITAIFFNIKKGKMLLRFIGTESLSLEISSHLYDLISRDFASKLAEAGNDMLIVDTDWADDILNK